MRHISNIYIFIYIYIYIYIIFVDDIFKTVCNTDERCSMYEEGAVCSTSYTKDG